MPTATEPNGAAPASEARAAITPISQPRIVKPVPILLDKPRTMVMDFAAMEAFEDQTGLSAWGREAWDGRPRTVVALIWAALLHEDPDLSLDALKRLPCMSLGNMAYLTERLPMLGAHRVGLVRWYPHACGGKEREREELLHVHPPRPASRSSIKFASEEFLPSSLAFSSCVFASAFLPSSASMRPW